VSSSRLHVQVPEDLDREIRIYAASNRMRLNEVATEAFEMYLNAKKPPQEAPISIAS